MGSSSSNTPRPIPQRSAEQLMQVVNGQRGGKIVIKLANSRFSEVTVSARQGRVVLLFEDMKQRDATYASWEYGS